MKIKHFCTFKDGTADFKNPQAFRADCTKLDGKDGYLTIFKNVKHRSGNQNRYFHGVIIKAIVDETEHSADEIKGFLKDEFLRVQTKLGYRTKDTSGLDTAQFEAFCEDCRRWAAKFLNLNIMAPNEVDYNQIENI